MRKAAVALNLSQPAVSKAIAELEDALGLKLLERGRRGVEPTTYGTALVRRAELLVDQLRGALRELADLADPEGGEVRLGAMETLYAGLVGAAVALLSQRHPRMRFVLEAGQAPDLVQHFLLKRTVDFAVGAPTVAATACGGGRSALVLRSPGCGGRQHTPARAAEEAHVGGARRRRLDSFAQRSHARITGGPCLRGRRARAPAPHRHLGLADLRVTTCWRRGVL